MKKIQLQEYLTTDGKNPFRQWLEDLDIITKARIQDGENIIILLLGGDKSLQTKDIKHAQCYWDDYKRRKSL